MSMSKMTCRSFQNHIRLWAFLECSYGHWARYFSSGIEQDYQQSVEDMLAEEMFIEHFESCFDCRQRYGTSGVNSVPKLPDKAAVHLLREVG